MNLCAQFPPFVPELYGLGEKLLFQFKKDDVERIRYEKNEKKETKDKPKEEIDKAEIVSKKIEEEQKDNMVPERENECIINED